MSPVKITEEMLSVEIPELIEDRARRYVEMGLSEGLAWAIADSEYYDVFEKFAEVLQPTIVARVLHIVPSELKKEGFSTNVLRKEHFEIALKLIAEGKIAKEGAEVLKEFCINPSANVRKYWLR